MCSLPLYILPFKTNTVVFFFREAEQFPKTTGSYSFLANVLEEGNCGKEMVHFVGDYFQLQSSARFSAHCAC